MAKVKSILLLLLCATSVACEEDSQDVETEDLAPPDISGDYDVVFVDVDGCEEFPEVPQDWVTGGLRIEGSGASLTFQFDDGPTFAGSVDETFTWLIDDHSVIDGVEVYVLADGLAYYVDDERVVLEGSMTIDWTDTTDPNSRCSIIGNLEANELER